MGILKELLTQAKEAVRKDGGDKGGQLTAPFFLPPLFPLA